MMLMAMPHQESIYVCSEEFRASIREVTGLQHTVPDSPQSQSYIGSPELYATAKQFKTYLADYRLDAY